MNLETKRLLRLFHALAASERATLLAFAEFLSTRTGASVPDAVHVPLDIPRPESETVVGAIKRLRETYPMLNRAKLLNDTSVLMTQHVMQGRETVEVIEALELMFRRHYEDHARGDDRP